MGKQQDISNSGVSNSTRIQRTLLLLKSSKRVILIWTYDITMFN